MKNHVLAFIMLTLTAISGAAVVSAIRQRACANARCARHDGSRLSLPDG
jgi:hypothetical protein